jgi:AraC-like DNA-binding protein
MKPTPSKSRGDDAGPRSSGALAAIAQAERAFPNAAVELGDDGVHRSLHSRVIANHGITHLLTPQTTVEACGRRAMRVGFGNRFKLLWQLAGVLHFESAHRSFALRPGEMIITPLAWTYRLEMDENRFDRIELSPACFIRQQRPERVRAEIVSEPGPEISLTTIALRNGFSDSSSFSRAFKAAFGISPSGFRALKRSA